MDRVELATLLHRALEARLGVLLEGLAPAGWQEDPEGLHKVRVTSRRVRAVLDLVEPERYPAYARQARKLRRLTRALGPTRELDVHGEVLEALRSRLPEAGGQAALEYLLEKLAGRTRKARATMLKRLGRLSLKRLPRLLEVAERGVPGPQEALGAWACLLPWVANAFAPMRDLLEQEDEAALHELRIRIKRLRYTLEVLGPAFPLEPIEALRDLKALQKALGRYHDLSVLEPLVRSRHRGLAERKRVVLAEGTGRILAVLEAERLGAYAQFQTLAALTSREAFLANLQRELGFPKPQEGNPSR